MVLFEKREIEMLKIYETRSDGIYVPVCYYSHSNGTRVILTGMVHVGEEHFYQRIKDVLQRCDRVIYEEPFARNKDTMRALDEAWSARLYDESLDEAFIAAIFLPPPPQKFIDTHGLLDEAHYFDFSQAHWISGDGAWGLGSADAALPMETWDQIYEKAKTIDARVKIEKVCAAKEFLQKVEAGSASMQEYISFRNLYEEEIEKIVKQSTLVDPRDDVTFRVFDEVVCSGKELCIGIKFGNGHVPHMDELLRNRGYILTGIAWFRVLTTVLV